MDTCGGIPRLNRSDEKARHYPCPAVLLLVWMLAPEAVGQDRGRGTGGGAAAEQTPPTVFLMRQVSI